MSDLLVYISPVWFAAQLALFFFFVRALKNRYTIRPIILVPLFLVAYPLIGLMNLAGFQTVLGWYQTVDASNAYQLTSIATLCLIAVLFSMKSETLTEMSGREFQQETMMVWIRVGTLVGLLLNLLNFASIGGIPIFWSNLTGTERFELANRLFFPRFLLINSSLIALNILRIGGKRKGQVENLIYLMINLVVAASIGSRHLVVLPIAIGGIFMAFKRKISLGRITGFAFGLALVLFALQILRGDRYDLDLISFFYSFGGEYRDFVLLRDYFGFTDYRYGATVAAVLFNMIPKELFSLVGLVKANFAQYSAYIAQDIWGADTGIRTGIWGELYMNWGDWGVLLGMPCFGIALVYLDRAISKWRLNESRMLLLSLAYTLVLFSIVGSWATIGDTLETYGAIYVLIALFLRTSEKRADSAITLRPAADASRAM